MNKLVIIASILLLIGCSDDDESGQLLIAVNQQLKQDAGIKAFIFLNDSLYGKTDVSGIYENTTVQAGTYNLTCSAINFADTTFQITVNSGKTTKLSLYLMPDNTFGIIYGEFHDLQVFNSKAIDKPEIKTWDEKGVYDGVTGATMYKIGYPDPIPTRMVSLDDSLLTKSDGFGQYVLKIQSGTYILTGACNGYANSSRIVRVLPGSKNYLNFFLCKE